MSAIDTEQLVVMATVLQQIANSPPTAEQEAELKQLTNALSELVRKNAFLEKSFISALIDRGSAERSKFVPDSRTLDALTLKEQLLRAIETLPSNRLSEALTFTRSLQTEPSSTTAQSFLTHLKTIGSWSGDDLQDCLEAVQNSRGEAQFDYSPNPFD
jgi:hypothetical protein